MCGTGFKSARASCARKVMQEFELQHSLLALAGQQWQGTMRNSWFIVDLVARRRAELTMRDTVSDTSAAAGRTELP
jgi:hypothetical protein